MAKQKVTITLNRSKADVARSLLGAKSTSQAVDLALDRLIATERRLRDIAAYQRIPATDDEVELALLADTWPHDDTDWEALYARDDG